MARANQPVAEVARPVVGQAVVERRVAMVHCVAMVARTEGGEVGCL